MKLQQRIGGLGPAIVVVMGAATLLVNLGYTFELNDQLQYLLLPYRSIYPEFALGDWFTWETSHYHISYAWVIRGLNALSGPQRLPGALFLAHVATLTWLCLAIVLLSRTLGTGVRGAAVLIAVIAFVRHDGIAGATFSHGQLVPADLALPPFILATVSWIEGKPRRTGLWLGLSGLLHSNYAVLGPLLVGLAEVLGAAMRGAQLRQAAANLARVALVYTPLAFPSLWLIGNAFALGDSAPAAVRTVFEVRSPHHYDLSAMERADLWWVGALLASAIPTLAHAPQTTNASAVRARLLLSATTSWLVIAVLGSLMAIDTVVRLFLWRLSPILVSLLVLLAVRFWSRLAAVEPPGAGRPIHSIKTLWALTCLFSLCGFARSDMAYVAPFGAPPPVFALPAVVATGLAGVLASARRASALSAVTLVAALVAAQVVTAEPVPHARAGAIRKPTMAGPRIGRFVFGPDHKHVKQQALVEWLRLFTPPGTRMLVPPSLISLRLRTHRAVFVDFKAAPMRGEEVLEWKRRMLLAMGVDDFPTRGYRLRYASGLSFEQRPLAELADLARSEHLDLVVTTPHKGAKRAGLEHMATLDGYAVYRVRQDRPKR